MARRVVRFVWVQLVQPVYVRLAGPIMRRFSGLPSAREKAEVLIQHADRQRTRTLIETGTYQGETVAACLAHFDRIYTIELDQSLYEAARDRFAEEPSVTVIHGDSYTELSKLAAEVTQPVLFWLDAHYSYGETAKGEHDPPLPWELRAIVARGKPDVILIDDARHMGVLPDYPSIEEIRELVGERASSFEVEHDIIRVTLA
jgi:predicted O-methyltransferase YrrM